MSARPVMRVQPERVWEQAQQSRQYLDRRSSVFHG